MVHPGSSYNHVAYVVWVSEDRTRYGMSDMGWCADCGPSPEEVKIRTIDDNDEFIHCAGDPLIPTTDWTFTICPFGWTPSKGFSATELTGSSWNLNPTQNPFLLSPVLALPASEHDGIEVRMANHAADTAGKVYFTTAASSSFDEAKSVSFSTINDGTPRDYLITMRVNPLWAGTITRIRLVPVGEGNSDGSPDNLEIARIRFVGRIGDSVPPNQATNVRPDGWSGPYTAETSLNFAWDPASDDPGGSGMAGYYVAVDDWTPDGTLDNDWWAGNVIAFTLPAIQADGSHIVAVTSKDNENNTNPANTNLPGDAPYYRFEVDLMPPTAPVIDISGQGCDNLPNNTWQNRCSTPDFSWTTVDAGSGVRDYLIYWESTPGSATGSVTTTTTFSPGPVAPAGGAGSGYLSVVATDQMDHSSAQSTFVLRYDGAAPTLGLTINGGAATAYGASAWLDLAASDEDSGTSAVRLSRNGTDWDPWQPYRETLPWTVPLLDQQEHVAYAQVRDRAGNLSHVASGTITLDLYPLMPHSDSFRICASTLDTGGSSILTSTTYSLISAVGVPWSAGNSVSGDSETELTSGFLSEISACLPITRSVATQSESNLSISDSVWGQVSGSPYTLSAGLSPETETAPGASASPTSTFGVTINNGEKYTNEPWVTVQTWAPQGVLRRLSNNSAFVNEGWMTHALTATWALPNIAPSVQPRTVYAWFRDVENQLYGPYADEIIVDTVPPVGFVAILGAVTENQTLLIEATDENSGVDLMRVGEDPVLNGASWQPYTSTLGWSSASPTAYVQFRDRAGNLSLVYGSRAAQSVQVPIVLRNR